MTQVVSSLRGRMRIRDPQLRLEPRLNAVIANLESVPGVFNVTGNLKTGSILLQYDPEQTDADHLEKSADKAIHAAARIRQPAQPSLKRQVNRAAKIGMMGSLATSLALVATGQKKGHAAAGGVFLACLGLHTAVHRKSLFR